MKLSIYLQDILDCRTHEAEPIRSLFSNLHELKEIDKVFLFIQDKRGYVSKLRQDGILNHYPLIPKYGIRCNVKKSGSDFKMQIPLSEETIIKIEEYIRSFLKQQGIENVIITLENIVYD